MRGARGSAAAMRHAADLRLADSLSPSGPGGPAHAIYLSAYSKGRCGGHGLAPADRTH